MAERRRTTRRLSTRLLISIFTFSTLAVLAITAVSFYISYTHAYHNRLAALEQQSVARIQREMSVFLQAEQNTQLLATAFLRDYQQFSADAEVIARFDDWFTPSDGIRRMHPAFAEGHYIGQRYYQGLSGFLGHYEQPYDDELKARIVLAAETLANFAPAWQHLFANTHISLPENALLLYAPDKPWGLMADSQLDIRQGAVVAASLQANNPQRKPDWTGLYYDSSAKVWAVTYQHPVDLNGQHLITPSHDLYLSDIIARLIRPVEPHSMHFLFNTHGQLIASPNSLPEETQFAGVLHVDRLLNPFYAALYQQISANPPKVGHSVLVTPLGSEQIYSVVLMAGPNWYYVTKLPIAQLRQDALKQALSLALLAAVLLLCLMLIVSWFIQQQVSQPLRRLAGIAEMIAAGHYRAAANATATDVYAHSEVGLLNRTMRDMAEHIEDHQRNLVEQIDKRTSELAEANVALERLAHFDGLTGAMNRRAFDRDLQLALQQAVQTGARLELILFDVDFFKAYNDHQGHQAGDRVLQLIVTTMQVAGTVYRYGGEELAMLCSPTSDVENGQQLAEQLRAAIQALDIPHPDSPFSVVTVSAGVGRFQLGKTTDALIFAADKALYAAKSAGRNGVAGE